MLLEKGCIPPWDTASRSQVKSHPGVILAGHSNAFQVGLWGYHLTKGNNGKTERARSSWECHSGGENFLLFAYDHLQGNWEHQLDESPGLTAEGTVPPKSTRWQSREKNLGQPRSGEDKATKVHYSISCQPHQRIHGRWRETALQCLRLFSYLLN